MSKIRKPSVSSKDNAEQLLGTRKSFSRRSLLKSAAGRGGWRDCRGLAGTIGTRAQVQGLYTSNEPPEIPLPSVR